MKKAAYIFAGLVAIATVVVWSTGGFHTGWTQTRIPVTGTDEITGITYTQYEDGFVPGLDVLGGGLIAAALIVGATLGVQFLKSKKS